MILLDVQDNGVGLIIRSSLAKNLILTSRLVIQFAVTHG